MVADAAVVEELVVVTVATGTVVCGEAELVGRVLADTVGLVCGSPVSATGSSLHAMTPTRGRKPPP
jgi:hypothetical protein